jgi:gliding motility-associated-like protein
LNLSVKSARTEKSDVVKCEGEIFSLPGGRVVNASGIYADTARTSAGCDSLVRVFTVQFEKFPRVVATKSNDVNCNRGLSTLSATGGRFFRWTDQRGVLVGTEPKVTVKPTTTTVYTVESWNVAGCGTRVSLTVLVDTSGSRDAYPVPTAFTPNGDGLNDCFHVRFWGTVSQFRMDVFNRWGELVFSTTDIQKCWDGTSRGKTQPTGNFPFLISGTGLCGDIRRMGIVTLVR